jgi:hypothetical protein
MQDKRLNRRNVYKRRIDKTKEGIELLEHRKRSRRKGSVTFHIGKDGIVSDIENKEFI